MPGIAQACLLPSKPAEAQGKNGQNEGRGSALTPCVPMDLKQARGRSALQRRAGCVRCGQQIYGKGLSVISLKEILYWQPSLLMTSSTNMVPCHAKKPKYSLLFVAM